MFDPNGRVELMAQAWREGGLWRVRLLGPEWLLTDLAAELAETNQQLDIVGGVGAGGTDLQSMQHLSSIVLSAAPRRPRPYRRQADKAKGEGVIEVDREAFFKP